jgi:hypothetical protein
VIVWPISASAPNQDVITSMKRRSAVILFVLLSALNAFSQSDRDRAPWIASLFEGSGQPTTQGKSRVTKFDFAPLWIRLSDNASILGYIGDDYQRLRLVILSARKDPKRPDTYNVTGKSMVKNVVRPFNGTMKITKALSTPSSGLDEDYKGARVREAGAVVGEYHFSEDPKQTNTGSFDGNFVTYWIVDRSGKFQYDEVLAGADGYTNNQFAGTWTSYRTKVKKTASWGDSRIPLSGDLDIGAGEFSPDEKYISNGWNSYHDAYTRQDKRAVMEERRQWWK